MSKPSMKEKALAIVRSYVQAGTIVAVTLISFIIAVPFALALLSYVVTGIQPDLPLIELESGNWTPVVRLATLGWGAITFTATRDFYRDWLREYWRGDDERKS